MKKKIVQMLGGFLALMLLFTMLSRAADSMGLPRVETVAAQRMSITHRVTAEGKVEQNREQAVSTEPNQLVKAVYVDEGQQVEKGDLLFELDMDELEEQILLAKQEMEKQDLQTGDSQSAQSVAAQRKALEQQQAASDYADAKSQGDRAVEKAKQELDAAKKALEESGRLSGGEKDGDSVEAELKKTVEEKKKACEQAKEEYQKLEQELAAKIAEALAQAEKSTQTAETASEGLPQAGKQETELEKEGTQAEETQAEGLAQTLNGSSALDSQKIETELRSQYQASLDAAKEKAETAEKEQQDAELALEAYQENRAAQEKEENQTSEEQLKEAVKEKQSAYEEAVAARDSSLRSAGNAVADAAVPEASDSAVAVAEIEREQKELELSKLEALSEAQGKITSPVRGVVTKVAVTTGDRTPDGMAVLLADLSSGVRFVAQVPKEQEKYIARKDEAELTAGSGGEKLTGLEISTVRANEEDPGLLDVAIDLPADTLEMGVSATMEVSRKSGTYQSCLPLSAIHYDSSQAYVLVAEESETVLGTELTARRVDVTIEDKNEQYAALQEGVLTSEQRVIQNSDRSVEPGGRIRLAEE